MNIKQEFFKQIQSEGLCPDVAVVLDGAGLLKEGICERYLIKKKFMQLKAKGKSLSWIFSELGQTFNKSEDAIRLIVYKKY